MSQDDKKNADLVDTASSLEHDPAHAYVPDADNPYYVPTLAYSDEEEARVIRILDTRLFPWILLTTFVLNMDRTNHSNAVSDNLPQDLGFTIDTVNLGVALYSVIFSFACLAGAVIAKIVTPSRCTLPQASSDPAL